MFSLPSSTWAWAFASRFSNFARSHLTSGQGCCTFLPLSDAGWSSLVARRAHNPKVPSSNLGPATNFRRLTIQSALLRRPSTELRRSRGCGHHLSSDCRLGPSMVDADKLGTRVVIRQPSQSATSSTFPARARTCVRVTDVALRVRLQRSGTEPFVPAAPRSSRARQEAIGRCSGRAIARPPSGPLPSSRARPLEDSLLTFLDPPHQKTDGRWMPA